MRRPNRYSRVIAALFLLTPLFLPAQSAVLDYLEGEVTLEPAGAVRRSAALGDVLQVGDTVFTGPDGVAEIAFESDSRIVIRPGSVFNYSEVNDPSAETRKRGFLRVLLGEVALKFRGLKQDPDVGTTTTVCSVRGTDFTVYASPDGSSLTVVSDGLVEVSSSGEQVLLARDQGVELVNGLGLTEPFDAKRGFVRYDAFVNQAVTRSEADIAASLSSLSRQLSEYAEQGAYYKAAWEENYEVVKSVQEKVLGVKQSQGDDAAKVLIENELNPLQTRSLGLVRTYRYHLLSGLFLRRYVLSSYYVRYRTRFLNEPDNPEWIKFMGIYQELMSLYEDELLPQLEDEDL